MKALRNHIKGVIAVSAVVLGLGAAGAAYGGHLSNTQADQFAASHPMASTTMTAPTTASGQATAGVTNTAGAGGAATGMTKGAAAVGGSIAGANGGDGGGGQAAHGGQND